MQHPPGQPAAIASVSPLAAEMAQLDGVAERLLAAHVSDARGYCRGCELPQAGPMRWPCTLWAVATTARAAIHGRSLPDR